MVVGPGSYWESRKASVATAGGLPSRLRVVRLIPSDDGPFVYARDLLTCQGVVVRFNRWSALYRRVA